MCRLPSDWQSSSADSWAGVADILVRGVFRGVWLRPKCPHAFNCFWGLRPLGCSFQALRCCMQVSLRFALSAWATSTHHFLVYVDFTYMQSCLIMWSYRVEKFYGTFCVLRYISEDWHTIGKLTRCVHVMCTWGRRLRSYGLRIKITMNWLDLCCTAA